MLAPLLLLWPMSLGLTWVVAQTIANRPYDRELADQVRTLARQVAPAPPDAARGGPGALRERLQRSADAMVRADDEDHLYFQVLGARGELVAGDATLPVPAREPQPDATVRFRDATIGDEPVRVAHLWLAPPAADGDDAADRARDFAAEARTRPLVQVAETLGKRSQLATEIIKGVILPQFVILPLAVLLVWFALARGIRPLAELQRRIRKRDSTDLSPLAESDVPDEVAPLVGAINDLLQRLERGIATQRHFLADAAHQLKTPLAGLRMQAELAAREIDAGTGDGASMKHSLRQIAVSTQRAAHVVDQLLALARAEDTAQQLRKTPLNLAALTRAVVRDFVPRAIERQIDLGYEGPADSPPGAAAASWLLGEPVLLGELVRNLVDNALRYTPRGGSVTARVLADPFGQVAVLQVEDSGPGIAPAEREAVFRPFYRVLDTGVDGSGLGLAIVREIAQHHGATIDVDDARPRQGDTATRPGARFTLRFPLAPRDAPATAHAPAAPAAVAAEVLPPDVR